MPEARVAGAGFKSPGSLASQAGSGRGSASLDERSSMGTAEVQELLWRRKLGKEQLDGLELGHLIGRGSFGAVYQGARAALERQEVSAREVPGSVLHGA